MPCNMRKTNKRLKFKKSTFAYAVMKRKKKKVVRCQKSAVFERFPKPDGWRGGGRFTATIDLFLSQNVVVKRKFFGGLRPDPLALHAYRSSVNKGPSGGRPWTVCPICFSNSRANIIFTPYNHLAPFHFTHTHVFLSKHVIQKFF